MKRPLLYLLLTIILASGCLLHPGRSTAVDLNGTWRLYDVELRPNESGKHSFSEEASLKQLVKKGNVICFFENGTYTELKGEGEYKSGRFTYEAGKNLLQLLTGEKDMNPMEVNMETNKNGKGLLLLQNKQSSFILKFIKEGKAPNDFHDAPFYSSNNQWRVKPTAPEDSTQLINRLTAYIKHVALILKAAKEEKQNIVSFEFSQGPIKIYNGGIGIHPFALVPESWKNSFYNEGDALLAYQMYQHYLRTASYRGAGTGDWVEDDYTILLSIYADLTAASNNKQ